MNLTGVSTEVGTLTLIIVDGWMKCSRDTPSFHETFLLYVITLDGDGIGQKKQSPNFKVDLVLQDVEVPGEHSNRELVQSNSRKIERGP